VTDLGRAKGSSSYAPDADKANLALASKAPMFRELGLEVSVCGTQNGLL
jgi:hypothetical protein